MQRTDIHRQIEIIKGGVSEIISEEELFERLKEERPLKIKAGFDPTAPDIHLGHTILLNKLRQFQDLGHKVYFLIGDFTARIGDPSGQQTSRQPLSDEEIKRNATTYRRQVFKILDREKTEILFNSQWLEKLDIKDFLGISSFVSVAQILARADFKKRYEEKSPISLQEFIYPILQAYDSVYLKADVEIGGIDQKFNLLMGRQLQENFGQKPQIIVMLPLLEGIDGKLKMSKSFGNYIGIDESPSEMFGKIMSISDELMYKYYEVLTQADLNQIKRLHPKEAKLNLASMITKRYHGESASKKAREEFERIFKEKGIPSVVPVYKLSEKIPILKLLLSSGLVKSGNEGRRLLREGAVSFDGERIKEEKFLIEREGILKVGLRRFLKVEKI
jgi:tyrosyl-tRNA synthetase